MPFLIWAALRFGPPLTSASFTVVAFLVIWGAGHGRGPFLHAITQLDALPIQLFLISIGVPLLLLAAVIEERRTRRAQAARIGGALFHRLQIQPRRHRHQPAQRRAHHRGQRPLARVLMGYRRERACAGRVSRR